jgi:hypothetical protein
MIWAHISSASAGSTRLSSVTRMPMAVKEPPSTPSCSSFFWMASASQGQPPGGAGGKAMAAMPYCWFSVSAT